jgi:DNA-directed RNA polymerase sigma subunit (sigma70/sigma32)
LEEKIQKLEDELDENKQSVFRKRTLLNNKISENTLQIVAQQKNIDDLKEHDLQQEKALSLLQFDVHQARVQLKPSLFLRRF